MKKGLTELVFILDRSGSMAGLEKDTIGGFNAMIEKQKQEEGEAYISTVLFDHEIKLIHDRVPLREIRPLTEQEYFARGSTALIDAMGSAIRRIRDIHRVADRKDLPQRTLFVITTDGMENSSVLYSSGEVRQMVQQMKQEQDWEFLFLGANIDAVETAGTFGIDEDRAVNYSCDSQGADLNFESIGEAVCSIRENRPLSRNWKQKIDEDFKTRRKNR